MMKPIEIQPYRLADGTWVFDDARAGLVEEPLIEGTDRLIEAATAREGIASPEQGFRLWFSDEPFTGQQYRLDFVRLDTERLGNWYWSADFAIEHWLCPALFRYFPEAPAALYVAISAMDTGD